MPRFVLATALLLAPAVLLSGCGGGSEADREVCDAAADLSVGNLALGPAPQDGAARILRELSSYTPENDRLVRAVDRARDDAQSVIDAHSPFNSAQLHGGAAALQGSIPAIRAVCEDLGF